MIRLFVGIPIPADIESHLSMMLAGLPGARWVNEENYHLTLRFIGEVDEGLAGDIDVTLGQINHPIFELSLEGVGYFGKPNAARAVWAGVAKSENLLHLHAKIETALQRMGQPAEERKYTPHVTLARIRGTPKAKLDEYIAGHMGFAAGPIAVRSFTLFSSFLSSSGAIYIPEANYTLG